MPPSNPNCPAPPSPDVLLASIIDSSDDAIVSKDLNGIITSWNKSAERIFGYTRDEAIGRSVTMLLPPGREAEEQGILERIRRGERVDHFETVRQRKNGQLVDVSVTISPMRDASGQIVGASKIARDITGQKSGDRAGLLLAAIVSSSDDAIVSKNLDGIITSWNAGAERIFGYTAEEAVGRPVLMLVPVDRKDEEPKILSRLRKGERVDHFETIRVRKNGEHFHVSLTISPVKDLTGAIMGASKIARDISDFKRISAEREQLLESERAARAQAEHANRMKDEFVSTVSHELRTPLNAIVGWTQVLKESVQGAEDLMRGVEIIERNARIQAQLIDDLLDLGRISTGKLALDIASIEPGAVVQEAIASIQPTADLKRIRIKTVLDSVRGTIMGDKQRLLQVVWNLMSNAIKFTPSGGSVVITVTRVNSHLEISVSDNGRGIGPDFLPHVFERFRQADSSTTRQHGGLGIGLALVKQLVELHGGQVHAESAGEGKGATFTVSLPVASVHSDARRARHAATSVKEVDISAAEELAGVKVLAVDDDRDSLEVIKRILISRHAQIETANSVDEALSIFPAFRPHVILSDIGMPGRDGYELVRCIRELPGGTAVPAAALTALARTEDRMRALRAGFQTHLSKPVAPLELVAVVRSLAALHAGQAN
ncbi:MAG TPA: PAS domain S-box protein [Opitutaceae bacterium]|nr:PAS domain S-box protein [Opitutaceae bacterium]